MNFEKDSTLSAILPLIQNNETFDRKVNHYGDFVVCDWLESHLITLEERRAKLIHDLQEQIAYTIHALDGVDLAEKNLRVLLEQQRAIRADKK